MSKRILVMGGAGFIGSQLCERFVAQGHDVICADNFLTGTVENIDSLRDSSRFQFLRHDVVDPLFLDVNLDEIYNFACPVSPLLYKANPIQTVKACVLGSINMLNLAKRNRAAIFQVSTSEFYADPLTSPQSKNCWVNVNPIGRRSYYEENRRSVETLFFDYHRQHQMNIKVAHLHSTYGPRMHPKDGRMVSDFIIQALAGKPITINGDGSQTLPFCYVDDTLNAIEWLMRTPQDFIGPVNLGSLREVTVLELAKQVLELTNSSSELRLDRLHSDPQQLRPDNFPPQQHVGWEPKVPLVQGLMKTIEYFDTMLRNKPKLAFSPCY